MNNMRIVSGLAAALMLMLPAGIFRASAEDTGNNVRKTVLLNEGWKFGKGETPSVWEDVSIPHDWAIYGPFDRDNDIQTVVILQNGEETASVKTGRTGGLPYTGTGRYTRDLEIDLSPAATRKGRKVYLLFDGQFQRFRESSVEQPAPSARQPASQLEQERLTLPEEFACPF